MQFNDCVDGEYLFYGVDNHMFKIDEHIFEVLEDESDGYRSYLGAIESIDKPGLFFFREPIAIVRLMQSEDDAFRSGYKLVDDTDEHIWLEFGTDTEDDYYPSFYFNYTPKPRAKTKPPPPKKRIHDHDIHPFDRLFDPRES